MSFTRKQRTKVKLDETGKINEIRSDTVWSMY